MLGRERYAGGTFTKALNRGIRYKLTNDAINRTRNVLSKPSKKSSSDGPPSGTIVGSTLGGLVGGGTLFIGGKAYYEHYQQKKIDNTRATELKEEVGNVHNNFFDDKEREEMKNAKAEGGEYLRNVLNKTRIKIKNKSKEIIQTWQDIKQKLRENPGLENSLSPDQLDNLNEESAFGVDPKLLEQTRTKLNEAIKTSDAAKSVVNKAESSVAGEVDAIRDSGDVAHEMCPATCAVDSSKLACTGCWDIVESIEMFAQELPCPSTCPPTSILCHSLC